MLEFNNINKSYNSNHIIKDASGILAEGEVTALIGPSGSGKSTLFRLLSVIEKPDSGIISLDGNVLINGKKKSNSPAPWPKITMVFQQLFLWPNMSMMRNILLPHNRDVIKSEPFQSKLNELIQIFELGSYTNRYPNQLSIGQRQRITLVRALMLNPKYLLLDEITSSLDIEHIEKVKLVIQKEKGNGTSFIVATHLIGFAKSIADHVWFLEEGKFIEQGKIEVLVNPKTERLRSFLSLIE
jgi:ABC-type polar amino acid transport system ATPase subunit